MGISILLFLTWNGAQFLNHISGNRWGTSLTNDGNHVISKLILLIQGILSGKHMGTQFNKRCELSQNTANDQQKDTPSNQALENQHFSIGCRNASFIAMGDTQMAMPTQKTWCCSNTRIKQSFDWPIWHHLILATRHVVFHQGHPTPIVLSPWPWWNRWNCAAWVSWWAAAKRPTASQSVHLRVLLPRDKLSMPYSSDFFPKWTMKWEALFVWGTGNVGNIRVDTKWGS